MGIFLIAVCSGMAWEFFFHVLPRRIRRARARRAYRAMVHNLENRLVVAGKFNEQGYDTGQAMTYNPETGEWKPLT